MSKISHSAYRKYLTCPKMYDWHYNHRLRPCGTSSSLIFGTSIDEALNAMLLKTGNPYEVFKEQFTLEKCKDIQWHSDDYDQYIFTKDQLGQVLQHDIEYRNWASLRVKGRMILEAYESEILPKIKKVYAVQRELNERKGFIDAIVDIEPYGKVLIDHKTSSRPYKSDAIEGDTQLHLYAKEQGIEYIGFAVLHKKINHNKKCSKCGVKCHSLHKTCPMEYNNKRCHGKWDRSPEATTQLLIEPVNPYQAEIVSNSIANVENAIKLHVYPQNLGACRSYYGQNCPYLNKCLRNINDGLEYKKEEE